MSFLYPICFAALILIPIILLSVIIIRRNRAKVWSVFVSPQHQSKLVKLDRPIRFWLSLFCSLIGLICLIIAMSRPYLGNIVSREKIESRNILIAMDTSLSMLCDDVQPNRLSSGVAFAVNLIKALPEDHFGIMAYAGSPNVITSLSIDHPSIIEELGQLSPGSAHTPGSNLKEALYEGINTLKRAGKQANALILITDGAETLDEINQITSIAKQSYVQIFTIGVGTSAGGTIPINDTLHLDREGKVVITKLEDNVLRQLARDTAGVYTHINTRPDAAIADAIHSMKQYEQQGREIQIPNELYQWFLAPGIALFILSTFLATRFRSNLNALIILGFFSTISDSRADETSWIDEISTKYLSQPALSKAGYTALENKDYAAAIELLDKAREGTEGDVHAKLSLAIAEAAYRLRDYPLASQEYSQSLIASKPEIQNIAQYNLANTLFKKHTAQLKVPDGQELRAYLEDQLRNGEIKDSTLDSMEKGLANAITHYSDLLKIQPQHSSAESNKNMTEKVIQAIQQARKTIAEEKEQQEEQEKEKKDQEEQDKKDQEKKDGESPDKPEDDQDGDQDGDQESDKSGDQGKKKDGDGMGDQDDKKEKDPNSDQPEDSDAAPQDGESDDSSKDLESKQPDEEDRESDTDKPAEFKNKEEALDFLRKHSDSRKKPLSNRRGYYNRPAIDW